MLKRKVVVMTHQRAGTHFLMRTLADHFPLTDNPFWLLDFNLGIDIWSPPALQKYLNHFKGQHPPNIMKSHFFAEFFADFIDEFTQEYTVLYLVRKPEDTLASYYTFTNRMGWGVSPKVSSLSDYIRAEPEGSCLRFQKKQYSTMLARWIAHVEGWLRISEQYPVHIIRYDDLNDRFDATVQDIAQILDHPTSKTEKPALTGILPWKAGTHQNLYSSEDMAYIQEHAGHLIEQIWGKDATPETAPAGESPDR